ncbi:MAG TPA: methyltransferase domain-containing protein [Gemmatimonadales bacterium]|nr:methyltransferase domain-containing protein [Gemmatimonadales bacterium]
MSKTPPVPDDRSYHLAEWRKSSNNAYLTRLLEPLDVKPGAVVLDVGCGSGYVSAYFSRDKTVRRNLAVDLVPQTLRLARELSLERAQGPIQWICGQAEQLPVGTSSVDHLVCRVVLPYTAITRAVAEISRSLSDGGSVLLQLHPWTLYARKLSLNPRKWKTSIALMLILLTGVIFHFTGVLFRPSVGRWRIGETFQTLSRMRALLRRHELSIYRIQSHPEFLVYAMKYQNSGRAPSA